MKLFTKRYNAKGVVHDPVVGAKGGGLAQLAVRQCTQVPGHPDYLNKPRHSTLNLSKSL